MGFESLIGQVAGLSGRGSVTPPLGAPTVLLLLLQAARIAAALGIATPANAERFRNSRRVRRLPARQGRSFGCAMWLPPSWSRAPLSTTYVFRGSIGFHAHPPSPAVEPRLPVESGRGGQRRSADHRHEGRTVSGRRGRAARPAGY